MLAVSNVSQEKNSTEGVYWSFEQQPGPACMKDLPDVNEVMLGKVSTTINSSKILT